MASRLARARLQGLVPRRWSRHITTEGADPGSLELPPTLRRVLSGKQRATQADGRVQELPVWISSVRKHGKVNFLNVTDGTVPGGQTLQVVLKGPLREKMDHRWTTGAAVSISGNLQSRDSPNGTVYEVQATQAELLAACDNSTYPLQDGASVETIRRLSHLRFRRQRDAAVLRARHHIERAMSSWFADNDFVGVAAPVLTTSDCEGGGEVFRASAEEDVDAALAARESGDRGQRRLDSFWSGTPAYLTVSSQLHLEALSLAMSRVWTITSAFRAEHSATNRHLAEFRMCEAELTCRADLQPVLNCVQGVVQAAMRAVLAEAGDAELLWSDQEALSALRESASIDRPWPRISYTSALQQLRDGSSNAPAWGEPLSSENERWLAAHVGRGPLFVTDYPADIKPFYMRLTSSSDAGPTVACFDLLIPGLGELAGGSLREERHDKLQEQLQRKGLEGKAAHLRWYTDDLRKYGGMPHGGFGIGMERLVSWLTATDNVRDCIPFPRTHGAMRF